jgi:hypothetical protein
MGEDSAVHNVSDPDLLSVRDVDKNAGLCRVGFSDVAIAVADPHVADHSVRPGAVARESGS